MARTSSDVAHLRRRVDILGFKVDLVALEDAVFQVEEWIRARERCRQVVVTGFHGLWEAHRDPEFHRILNAADLWVPDGIAPVLIARTAGQASSATRRLPSRLDADLRRPKTTRRRPDPAGRRRAGDLRCQRETPSASRSEKPFRRLKSYTM